MLIFKLADIPRSVRRLARPLPLGPERTSAPGQTVSWALAPALIDPTDTRTRDLVSRLLALYAEAEGRSRAALDTLPAQVEDLAGEYRLGRCLARAIEALGYHFAPPETALEQDAASLRALCYHRAQATGDGVIPRAERAVFLAGVAADLEITPAELENALCVHGDVELTHLRQDNMTLLFQAVRTWRVLSSLVDAERRGRQAGSRGVKLTWRSLGQISLALTCGPTAPARPC